MLRRAQVEAVKELLDKLLTDLPRFNSGLNQLGVQVFRYGIKDVSLSISVGAVELSMSLGGEDEPRAP
jgi:hypothetical protein